MADKESGNSRLRALPLALTLGIVWGAALLLIGIVTAYTDKYGHDFVEVCGSIYYGYGPGHGAAFIGLAWGFADAFIGTLIVVWLYRLICKCCNCCCTCSPTKGAEQQQ